MQLSILIVTELIKSTHSAPYHAECIIYFQDCHGSSEERAPNSVS